MSMSMTLSLILTDNLDVNIARVRLFFSIEGRAGVVALVGVLHGSGDDEGAVGVHLLAAIAGKLITIWKRQPWPPMFFPKIVGKPSESLKVKCVAKKNAFLHCKDFSP